MKNPPQDVEPGPHDGPPTEVKITPAMIEAGVDVLISLEGEVSKASLAEEVFRAMEWARQ